MVVSHAVRVAGGASETLLKYSARNWPVAHPPPDGVTVKLTMFERWPSGLTTKTGMDPAVAIWAAVTVVVSRVAPTNVVAFAEPFQKMFAPDTNALPSTVSVKLPPPAVAVFGVSVVIAGAGGAPASAQLAWITAPPPRS